MAIVYQCDRCEARVNPQRCDGTWVINIIDTAAEVGSDPEARLLLCTNCSRDFQGFLQSKPSPISPYEAAQSSVNEGPPADAAGGQNNAATPFTPEALAACAAWAAGPHPSVVAAKGGDR